MENTTQEMIQAQIVKILADIDKTLAETRKINRETYWYPLVIIGSAFAAGGALVGGLIKMLS